MIETETALRISGFRGTLFDRDHPGYDEARRIYNGMFDRRPLVVARCISADDVVAALAYARRLRDGTGRFDVVFCDPPYADPLEPILENVVAKGWWTRAAVVEHAASRPPAAPPGTEVDTRRYGDTGVSIFRRAGSREAGDTA